MNLAGFLLKSRGVVGLSKRIPSLFTRFGVSEEKIARCLYAFTDITKDFGVKPTLAITANLIPRHPKLIRSLQDRGVEFAIHGLVHTDYAQLTLSEQRHHIKKSMELFTDYGIKFSGFRCPYLSSNKETLQAVGDLGLKWESSDVVSWDVIDFSCHTANQIQAYQKVQTLYGAKNIETTKSLPVTIGSLVEIPVSIPDDEALVDRLGVKDPQRIAMAWLDILKKSYARGELFTIQLHHERIGFCGEALARVLDEARRCKPAIWIVQLGEIADWATELREVKIEMEPIGKTRFSVRVNGSKRATILIKNAEVNAPSDVWTDGYRVVDSHQFEVTSRTEPAIIIPEAAQKEITEGLSSAGFIADDSELPTDMPLIKLWRWPYGTRSAIACTGDVDSITVIDFARRFMEV